MKKVSLVFLSLVLFYCSGKKSAVVFNGGEVSLSEVDEKAKMELYQLELQAYQIRQQAAYQLVQEKLWELEAKSQKKSKEEILEQYINQNQPITEELVRQIYEANKNQISGNYEQVKDSLKRELERQNKNSILQNLMQDLFKKYEVKFVLEEPIAPQIKIDLEDDPYWGPKDAKVVFVEFSDFECPYCKRMQPAIQQIKAEYSDRVRWVFKDFPLDFHLQAMKAHIAANCALAQDKYWELQQRIFNEPYDANRKLDLSEKKLLSLAKAAGLDEEKFLQCLKDVHGEIRREIEQDIAYGQKIGVRGTPTLYVNGRLVSYARTYEELKEIIEKLLRES